jgi:diadenosine tetraphosphate (Ap4A) HIT family hydrolase
LFNTGRCSMSDLGRLFRLRASGSEPLENFTSVALAIAIGHDSRPMKRALARVCSATCPAAGLHPALAAFTRQVADDVSVTARTQEVLWPTRGIRIGYLDLVLDVQRVGQENAAIWVEVKVDAGLSGDQLDVYKSHAGLLDRPPAIITLGRMQVDQRFPSLTWRDIVAAVDAESSPHQTWVSLREFLYDEGVVRPPVPAASADREKCIDVIVGVNQQVRRLWPKTTLVWQDGNLRNGLKEALDRNLVTSAGPLRYGLMPAGEGFDWGIVVTARKGYQGVALDTQRVLRAAEAGGLPQDWVRHTDDRFELLERRVPAATVPGHDEVVSWFAEGLGHLHSAGILTQFFERLKGGSAFQAATDCPLCTAAARPDTLAGNDHAVALLDGFPVNPGHALIVSRRHVADLFDLPPAEQAALWALLPAVKAAIDARYSPGGYNVGVNVGAAAGQTVDHVHVHVIPRYEGDVEDPRGGVRWVIPARADYWSHR